MCVVDNGTRHTRIVRAITIVVEMTVWIQMRRLMAAIGKLIVPDINIMQGRRPGKEMADAIRPVGNSTQRRPWILVLLLIDVVVLGNTIAIGRDVEDLGDPNTSLIRKKTPSDVGNNFVSRCAPAMTGACCHDQN